MRMDRERERERERDGHGDALFSAVVRTPKASALCTGELSLGIKPDL